MIAQHKVEGAYRKLASHREGPASNFKKMKTTKPKNIEVENGIDHTYIRIDDERYELDKSDALKLGNLLVKSTKEEK